MTGRAPIPVVLSIAGSDSGGGAGIQADLKAFARCGLHGATAITALTAQNTVGVTAIELVPREMIIAQVKAVVDDMPPAAVKIGMLGSIDVISAVRDSLTLLAANTPVVLDPVMVAESGAILMEQSTREVLIAELFSQVTVLTPNIHEARVLVNASDDVTPAELARSLHALGPPVVVVTGGHESGVAEQRPVPSGSRDTFFDGNELIEISGERFSDAAAHGSGCTHSSVLAAQLALGCSPLEAARKAKAIASEAVHHGLEEIGAGVGPVDVLNLGKKPESSSRYQVP